MAVHEFVLAKSGEGTDLGPLAIAYFGGTKFVITLPDAGDTPEETLARLLAACAGDHRNLRNIFVGQAARLTYQKAIKEYAKAAAPRVRLHERIEEARRAWVAAGSVLVQVTAEDGTTSETEPVDFGYVRTEDEADLEPETKEHALDAMVAIATGPVPLHKIKGEGEPSKKETETVAKARAEERKAQVSTAVQSLAGLSEKRKIRGLVGMRDTNPDLFAEAIKHPDLAPLAAKLPAPDEDED